MKKAGDKKINLVQRAIELVYDGNVRLNEYYGVWKVAWVSMGAVLPDKAEEMAKAISEIGALADMLNFHDIRREYKPNEMTDEEELEQGERIKELLEQGRLTDIVDWL